MAYEYVPIILFGILLLAVGFRIGVTGYIGIALVFAGLILIGFGGFTGWSDITSGLFVGSLNKS